MTTDFSWIPEDQRNEENAAEFCEYIARNCIWNLSDFGGHIPWDSSIPARDSWESEIEKFNEALEEWEEKL